MIPVGRNKIGDALLALGQTDEALACYRQGLANLVLRLWCARRKEEIANRSWPAVK
jgi:hypothetical protein